MVNVATTIIHKMARQTMSTSEQSVEIIVYLVAIVSWIHDMNIEKLQNSSGWIESHPAL